MYGEAEWRQARRLYGSGTSKSAIARRLGMSRTTVARLLSLQAPPRRKEDFSTGAQRKEAVLDRKPGHRRVIVLPPIMRPASAERAERVIRALAALLLVQMDGDATYEHG
jgi:DNA-binding transcriptional regulator LsrR (DeoR family)